MNIKPYKTLALATGAHFFIMYALTMVAVDAVADIKLFNLRSFYMAVIMVAPMVALMLFFMGRMFESRRLNAFLYAGSAVLFFIAFFFIRQQVLVGNEQFLKSMIPHHSSAITMCQQADIDDQEIKNLCVRIEESQQEEINQMNRILQRLSR